MSETPPPNGDAERTNLAPILAPIITLFIGFGAGVVFSEFIPLGNAPQIQPNPNAQSSGGGRDAREGERGVQPPMDEETRRILEDAAAQGDEDAQRLLDEQNRQSQNDDDDGVGAGDPGN